MEVVYSLVFFFNDTATTEIYTLSLHDALPIFLAAGSSLTSTSSLSPRGVSATPAPPGRSDCLASSSARCRSEEHTSELQSPCNLVCRLLLEKKKRKASLTNWSTSAFWRNV